MKRKRHEHVDIMTLLPRRLVYLIFERLSFNTIVTCRLVNRYWYHAITSDPWFWRRIEHLIFTTLMQTAPSPSYTQTNKFQTFVDSEDR